jgi:hypothetical protein
LETAAPAVFFFLEGPYHQNIDKSDDTQSQDEKRELLDSEAVIPFLRFARHCRQVSDKIDVLRMARLWMAQR